jgi:hypothetical protein
MVGFAILDFFGYRDKSMGAPANKWILLLVWIVYSLCTWKDKRKLFKRCVLALPFALLAVTLLSLTVFEISASCGLGILVLIVLTGTEEIKNAKQYFIISLAAASIVIILFVSLKGLLGLPPSR